MKMCIVGEGMEMVMEAARAYKEEAVQEYVGAIGELNEIVADYSVVIDSLEDECEALEAELFLAEDTIAIMEDHINGQQEYIDRLEAKVKMMPLALELGLGESEIEVALDMAQSMAKMLEDELQPACCAAGHCGTELCGGCCHTEVDEEEEEFDIETLLSDLTDALGINVIRINI